MRMQVREVEKSKGKGAEEGGSRSERNGEGGSRKVGMQVKEGGKGG